MARCFIEISPVDARPNFASNVDVWLNGRFFLKVKLITCYIALWDVQNQRCTRVPSCDLWNEEMLLEERERRREREAQPQPRGS